jgi:uncharacterized protein
MAEHRNVQKIREAYAGLAGGNLPVALQAMAPDAVFHFKGTGPLSGDHQGTEAIAAALVGIFEITAGDLQLVVSSVYADDHHAVVALRETASRPDGATLDVEEVHVLTLDPAGLITEIWDLPEDPDAHDAFFDGK